MCAIVARDKEAEDTSRSKVRSIQGFVAACLVLSVVFASLRFYVRLRILRSFRKDDWAVVATLILLICSGVMATVASHHGLGSHMSILTDSEKTFFLVLIWISSLGYLATTIAIKTAFLLQYRRAFPLPTFQRLCDIFLGFLAVWLLAGFITQFAICHPLSRQWDPMVIENGQSCKVRFHFWLANAIMHIATDIVLFIMPFPMIRNLSQNRMQKFVLGGVFSLGFFSYGNRPKLGDGNHTVLVGRGSDLCRCVSLCSNFTPAPWSQEAVAFWANLDRGTGTGALSRANYTPRV
ncbi:hypothetical protein S40285_05986 [Stachybotrys chlorohalonatus IBT 40285]|uniref:Rhodopsin domain-containing protein n=1 Tax=Stachybotrys chlorohalonatus (strain IBT 40285) TaxID=1283841 RepID=A0A084QBJ2_STAC4|nr:hypothetical protein S40285_05986 [Stachybotrys chlorohalonata IBT 40285]